MAKQTFTTGQVLTAAQVNALQTNDFNQTVSAKTASYVLVAADKGTRIEFSTSGSVTCTVNTGIFDAGDTVYIQNTGAGIVTITAGTATVNTSATLAVNQYEGGVLYFVSTSSAIWFEYASSSTGDITGITTGATSGLTGGVTSGTADLKLNTAAKGDLLVGTGAGTVSALSVGSNNQYILADSTQSTGLKYGSSPQSLLTATGDLLYASAANTPARLGIGSSNQVLTVSGGVPTWATSASGGMTSIASGSLSGSVTTVGSFSSSYTDLYLVITDVSGDTSGSLQLRINGDTTANFHVNNFMQAEVGQAFQSGQSITTQILTATGALNTPDNNNAVYLYIYDYNNSSVRKNYQLQAITNSGGNNATCAMAVFGGYQGTSAVTSIEIRITAGSFDGGTYVLYGVK
jgi:hypothetical protein